MTVFQTVGSEFKSHMTHHMNIFIFICLILIMLFEGLLLYCMCGGCETTYEPMGYDEEVKWLKEQGLTQEEAEEIANL